MGVLNNGMSLIGVSIDWQQPIKGLVLLAAVAFDFLEQEAHLGRRCAGAEDTAGTAAPPAELVQEIEHAEAPGTEAPAAR
jgi:putative multiple sugar transport system permease protein